jgi:sugar lactone lactonase YvrE
MSGKNGLWNGVNASGARNPASATGRSFPYRWSIAGALTLVAVLGVAATVSLPASADTGTVTSGLDVVVTSPAPPNQAVYIADTVNNRIVEVNPSGAQSVVLSAALGEPLNAPGGVSADAAGDVFVADSHNNRVLEVTPSGTPTMLGSGLEDPYDVTTDSSGNVYIADTVGERIVEISTSGSQSTVLGSGLDAPHGVAVDPAGDIFIADKGDNRVVELTPSGTQTDIGTGLTLPWGVAIDPWGDVFIADKGNDRVVEVTPNGTQTTIGSGFKGTTAVAVDDRGDVFVADPAHSRIVEVSPSGQQESVGTGLYGPLGVGLGGVQPSAATWGQAVTLTAGAFPAGSAAPTGDVTFTLGTTVLGSAPLSLTASGTDVAALTTTDLPVGVDTVTATYGGDSQYAESMSTAVVDVSGTAPEISGTPPPATVSSEYHFSFTVSGEPTPKVIVSRGTLPAGLKLTNAGVLSGTPTATAGTYDFTVQARNGIAPAASEKVTLDVSS